MTAIDKLTRLQADMQTFEKPKNARHYADEILRLRTREERAQALEQVPAEHRASARFYVHDYFAKRGRTKLPDLKT